MQLRVDDLPGGMTATAHVACSMPMQSTEKYWLIGIRLEQPGNWWRLAPSPQDWDQYSLAPKFASAH